MAVLQFCNIDVKKLDPSQVSLTFVTFGNVRSIFCSVGDNNEINRLNVEYATLEDARFAESYFRSILAYLSHQKLTDFKLVDSIQENTSELVPPWTLDSMRSWYRAGVSDIENSVLEVDIALNMQCFLANLKDEMLAFSCLLLVFNLISLYGRVLKIQVDRKPGGDDNSQWHARVKTIDLDRVMEASYVNIIAKINIRQSPATDLDINYNCSYSRDFTDNTLLKEPGQKVPLNLSASFAFQSLLEDTQLRSMESYSEYNPALELSAKVLPLIISTTVLVENLAPQIRRNIYLVNFFGTAGNVSMIRFLGNNSILLEYKNRFSMLYALKYFDGLELFGFPLKLTISSQKFTQITGSTGKVYTVRTRQWRYYEESEIQSLCVQPNPPSCRLRISPLEDGMKLLSQKNLDVQVKLLTTGSLKSEITAHGNEMLQLSGASAQETMENFQIVVPLLEISKKTNKLARSSSKLRKRSADVELSVKLEVVEQKIRLTEQEVIANGKQHHNEAEVEVKRSRSNPTDPDMSVQRGSSCGVSTGSTQWPLVQMGQSFSQPQQINRSHQRSIQPTVEQQQSSNTSVHSHYITPIPSYGGSFVQPMSSQQKVPLDPSTPRGRYPVQDNQANVYSQHSFQLQRYPQTWTPYDFIAVQPHAQPENNAYNNFQGTELSTANEYVYRPGYFRMINQSVPNSMEVYPGGYYTERSYVNERFPQRLNYRGNQTNQSRMVHNLQNYYDGESWSSQQPDNFQRIPQFPAIIQESILHECECRKEQIIKWLIIRTRPSTT
ncbi:hypothetical protein ACOME3_003313 [Neoechinorhynchus agilis]